VLGLPPPTPLEHEIAHILTTAGELTDLPSDVGAALANRRAESIRQGPWVERHWRPGQPL
jgi:hypothetical protein